MENNSNYRSLSKEDKLYNLRLTKSNIEQKVLRLQKQLEDIQKKIDKYTSSSNE